MCIAQRVCVLALHCAFGDLSGAPRCVDRALVSGAPKRAERALGDLYGVFDGLLDVLGDLYGVVEFEPR